MKTEKLAIIGLSALSAILILGWVIPTIPYVRRIPYEKAYALYAEYKKSYGEILKGLFNEKPITLADVDAKRGDEIYRQLTDAGYTMNFYIDSKGEVVGTLTMPSYAG